LRILGAGSLDGSDDFMLVVGAESGARRLSGLREILLQALDFALGADTLGPKPIERCAHLLDAPDVVCIQPPGISHRVELRCRCKISKIENAIKLSNFPSAKPCLILSWFADHMDVV